jgi:multiple sugar transport system permease protein
VTEHVTDPTAATPSADAGGVARVPLVGSDQRRGRYSVLNRRDRLTLGIMLGVPLFLVLFFVALPTILSIVLSFTSWNGITPIDKIEFTGLKNYQTLITKYPPFWPALTHNLIWLAWFLLIATPLGMFFAVLLDKNIRGTRIYQSALYLPVVLSLAIIAFIWQLQYSPTQGFINGVLGTNQQGNIIDWLGDKRLNLWAVLIAASWRQVGYVMILYLAGLKAFDPSLREAALIDGANERQLFFRVVFPVLRPINIVILVITMIESFRAFDIVYVINKGLNGLELLSVLVTTNIIGEAQRVGFGSAVAVVLLIIALGPILFYLSRAMRSDQA